MFIQIQFFIFFSAVDLFLRMEVTIVFWKRLETFALQ